MIEQAKKRYKKMQQTIFNENKFVTYFYTIQYSQDIVSQIYEGNPGKNKEKRGHIIEIQGLRSNFNTR